MGVRVECRNLPVTVALVHSRVDEEAAVAQLADLLGEELDALSTITENDSLGNVKLGEESVEAVQLLAFLQEGVVLREALQGQLISDLDVLGAWYVALLEGANLDWVSCAKEANLAIHGHHLKDLLNHFLELTRD